MGYWVIIAGASLAWDNVWIFNDYPALSQSHQSFFSLYTGNTVCISHPETLPCSKRGISSIVSLAHYKKLSPFRAGLQNKKEYLKIAPV